MTIAPTRQRRDCTDTRQSDRTDLVVRLKPDPPNEGDRTDKREETRTDERQMSDSAVCQISRTRSPAGMGFAIAAACPDHTCMR